LSPARSAGSDRVAGWSGPAAALEAFASGLLDAADALDAPLLIVDAGAEGSPGGPEGAGPAAPPAGYPGLVVAVAGPAGPEPLPPPPPCDVALTDRARPPAPWVAVDDPLGAARQLGDAFVASAGAGRVLLQLLRCGPPVSVEAGLVFESLAYSMLQAGPGFARWRASRPRRDRLAEGGDEVLVAREGDTVKVTLNRPAVHNAYSRRVRDLLWEALSAARADPGCQVILSGAGPSFCSGGDLDEFGTFEDPVAAHGVRVARSPARLLAALRDRVEVRLHGACAGSGIELPAFAGRVLAHPDTRIWLPELSMGLIPGAGGTVSLPGRIGRHRSAWLGLSGRAIDAATALDWGLVDGIHPPS
jgi:hypothetical protein